MANLILLSSGFIVPYNDNFLQLKDNEAIAKDIMSINRIDFRDLDSASLVKENVYISPTINKLYTAHRSTGEFEAFIKMIDIAFETLEEMQPYLWFKLQLEDSRISPIVKDYIVDFLKDLSSPSSEKTSQLYIPFNLRLGGNILDKNKDKYLKDLDNLFITGNYTSLPNTWRRLLPLMESKNKFMDFYRLVFVDFF